MQFALKERPRSLEANHPRDHDMCTETQHCGGSDEHCGYDDFSYEKSLPEPLEPADQPEPEEKQDD